MPGRAKTAIKSVDGHGLDLNALKKGSPSVSVSSNGTNRESSMRLESEEAKRKRVAEEEVKTAGQGEG